jgi:hypothetical protein
MTHPESQAERDAFEAALPKWHGRKRAGDGYYFTETDWMWKGWKLARAALPPVAAVPDGYVPPHAVTWHCELDKCVCHSHAANVRAKCCFFIAASPKPPESA